MGCVRIPENVLLHCGAANDEGVFLYCKIPEKHGAKSGISAATNSLYGGLFDAIFGLKPVYGGEENIDDFLENVGVLYIVKDGDLKHYVPADNTPSIFGGIFREKGVKLIGKGKLIEKETKTGSFLGVPYYVIEAETA